MLLNELKVKVSIEDHDGKDHPDYLRISAEFESVMRLHVRSIEQSLQAIYNNPFISLTIED